MTIHAASPTVPNDTGLPDAITVTDAPLQAVPDQPPFVYKDCGEHDSFADGALPNYPNLLGGSANP